MTEYAIMCAVSVLAVACLALWLAWATGLL
jgi:hypothetical protein